MVRLLGAGESGLSLIYRINCQNCNYCNYEKKSCIFLPFQNYKSRSKFFEFYSTSNRSIEDSLTLSRIKNSFNRCKVKYRYHIT